MVHYCGENLQFGFESGRKRQKYLSWTWKKKIIQQKTSCGHEKLPCFQQKFIDQWASSFQFAWIVLSCLNNVQRCKEERVFCAAGLLFLSNRVTERRTLRISPFPGENMEVVMVLYGLIPPPNVPPLTFVLPFCHYYIFYSFMPPQYIPPTNLPPSSGPLTRCISFSTSAHKT